MPKPVTVRDAVELELRSLPPVVSGSGLASAALVLADWVDAAGDAYVAAIARELRQTLDRLRELAQVTSGEADDVDELAAKRDARLKAAQTQAGSAGADDGGS